jgi:hypothetical protein
MSGAARALHWQRQRACPFPKGIGKPLKICRDWDRKLQLFSVNEEFQVSASHQLALITSLPFVHTARRCLELDRFEKFGDCRLGDLRVVLPMRTNLIAMI